MGDKQDAPRVIVETPETVVALRRLELIAEWLDNRYLDPLIGFLFPGAGDTACSLVGLYGVYVAAKLKVHPIIVARMLMNLGIDAVVGGVPLLGVIFDFFYKAHARNLQLIKDRGSYGAPTASDWALVLGALLLFLLALALPIFLLVTVATLTLQLLGSL